MRRHCRNRVFLREASVFPNGLGKTKHSVLLARINAEVGFKPYRSEIVWQVNVEQAQKYLDNHSGVEN